MNAFLATLWYIFVWPWIAFGFLLFQGGRWLVTFHNFDDGDSQEDCIGTLAALFGVLITQGISLAILEQASEVRQLSIWIYLGLSLFTLISIVFLISITKLGEFNRRGTYYFGRGSILFGRFLFCFGCAWVVLVTSLAWTDMLPLQVRSKKYVFKNMDQGAEILFPTAVEQESIDMGLDRLLTVKWDKSVNEHWTNLRVNVYSDPDLKSQISKTRLTRPKIENHQFYVLYRCKSQKCWIQVYLEPIDPSADTTALRRQLELDVRRKQAIVVENRFFPQQ